MLYNKKLLLTLGLVYALAIPLPGNDYCTCFSMCFTDNTHYDPGCDYEWEWIVWDYHSFDTTIQTEWQRRTCLYVADADTHQFRMIIFKRYRIYHIRYDTAYVTHPIDSTVHIVVTPTTDTLGVTDTLVAQDTLGATFVPRADTFFCSDNNPCTMDSCLGIEEGCLYIPMDCNDNDPCTIDMCTQVNSRGACVHTPVDCNDNDPCTNDFCWGNGRCAHEQVQGRCCTSSLECNDNNACTLDTCAGPPPHCRNIPRQVPGCCRTSQDCDDGWHCTNDYCYRNTCRNEPKCVLDDRNPCTWDTCIGNIPYCVCCNGQTGDSVCLTNTCLHVWQWGCSLRQSQDGDGVPIGANSIVTSDGTIIWWEDFHGQGVDTLSSSHDTEYTRDILTIYPNPSNGSCFVVGCITTFSVFDALGQLVCQGTGDGMGTVVSLRIEASGLYYAVVRCGDKVEVRKFIVL